MRLDKRLCRQIRYSVKQWIAPGITEHPGVVEFSRISRIWGEEVTDKDLKKCLKGLNAVEINVSGEDHYIFPDILHEAYSRIEERILKIEQELKRGENTISTLKAELEFLDELNAIWHGSWNEKNCDDPEESRVSLQAIKAFISSKFEIEEKNRTSTIEYQKKEVELKEASLKKLRSKLKNLFPFYSVLEKTK